MSELITHHGSCHCGAVRFQVDAPPVIEAVQCNCSICRKTGFLHLIVTRDHVRMDHAPDALTTYTFNTHTAKHTFCIGDNFRQKLEIWSRNPATAQRQVE